MLNTLINYVKSPTDTYAIIDCCYLLKKVKTCTMKDISQIDIENYEKKIHDFM